MAKQRQIRIEQKGAVAALQRLETLSDEELQNETKFKSAALAILGARAAERYDAESARRYFQRAIAAAKPQERMQIRRMAEASLALAERRADDLRDAVTKLGHEPPGKRQLFALKLMGLIMPTATAGALRRTLGILLLLAIVLVLISVGFGVVELVALPLGGVGLGAAIPLGAVVTLATLGVLALLGRRKQRRMQSKSS